MVEIKQKDTGKVLHRVNADSLRGCIIKGVDLRGADLRNQDLTGCHMESCSLSDADLRNATRALGGGLTGGALNILPRLDIFEDAIRIQSRSSQRILKDVGRTSDLPKARFGPQQRGSGAPQNQQLLEEMRRLREQNERLMRSLQQGG